MEYNTRTKVYLSEMKAVLIDSSYKIVDIDFTNLKALIIKQDTYKKRNGKTCRVEHPIKTWVQFTKDDISYGVRNYTTYDSGFYGLEEIKGQRSCKYLKSDVKKKIISNYINSINM